MTRNLRDRIPRRLRLTLDGGSSPRLPGKPFPGTSQGDIPPIIDTIDNPNPQTDLSSRQHLNRVQTPPPSELRGTIVARNEPIPYLFGEFRTHGKFLFIDYNVDNLWIFVFGLGERIDQPTKATLDNKDYTFTSQGSGRWHADVDGGGLWVYDGTQDYIDTRLQRVRIPDGSNPPIHYTQTHEGESYCVLQLTNPSDWPELYVVGQGDPGIRINGASDTRGYTTNPAWITARFIELTTSLDIDWPSVQVCADYCDETINGIKRSEIGIAINRRERINDWVAVLREYGYLYALNNGETVRFVCDKARDSVMSLGNNDIDIGQTTWTKGALNTTPDNVRTTWIDTDTGVEGETFALDQPSDLEDDYNMPAFLHEQQANMWTTRRFNKMTIRDLSGVVSINARGLALDFGDRVDVTDHRFSAISSKSVELLELRAVLPGKTVAKVIEYQENTYTDSPQLQPQTPDTTLPSPFDYPAAISFTVAYGQTKEGVTGDVRHWAEVSWETPDFPYVTGWHILAGWGGQPVPSVEPDILADIIMPPETTSFRVYGADPLWAAAFNPKDYNFYLTVLTSYRPNRELQFVDINDNLGGGTGADAANGVYHQYLEVQDDPTPGAVNTVQVTTVTGGVLVSWRYGRRPNYIFQFHVDIENVTDGDTQTTVLSDGLSVFVPDSVFSGDSGDTMRADVKVANRNITVYSSIASSSTFTAP